MASRVFWSALLLLSSIYFTGASSRAPSSSREHTIDKRSTAAVKLLEDLEENVSFLLEKNDVLLLEDKYESLPPRKRLLSRRVSRIEEAFVKLFQICFTSYKRCLTKATSDFWPAKVDGIEDRIKRLGDYLVLAFAQDCDELYRGGMSRTGTYYLLKHNKRMFCDMKDMDGAWTVLLRRGPRTVEDFHVSWREYANGFGDLNAEFWLGNRYVRTMTNLRDNELLVTMTDFYGDDYYALYDGFALRTKDYELKVGYYQGNATDALGEGENGMRFTTKDRDNDLSDGSCSISWGGGWWYRSCYRSHLTGFHVLAHNTSNFLLNQWMRDQNEMSLTILPIRAEMKFRPMQLVSRTRLQRLEDYKPKDSGSLFVRVDEPSLI